MSLETFRSHPVWEVKDDYLLLELFHLLKNFPPIVALENFTFRLSG